MKRLVKGNDAVVLGAIAAGCDAFFGYPITPASEIPQLAAEYFPKLGKVFLQAECETAAINMVYGAASCGRRAMTASSGPGISLKQEGISYLAGAELPGVIVDIMRVGPGLGNIGPEQSDYNQVVKGGGHGGYKTIVLAPNSVEEMFQMTVQAFELADQYRTPVYLLADATLGQMMEPIEIQDVSARTFEKTWKLDATLATNRNLIASIDLDCDALEARSRKLIAKYHQIEQTEAKAQAYQTEDAELILVGYGIVSRILRSVVDRLRPQGKKVGLLRPQTLWPFPAAAFQEIVERNPKVCFFVVELSSGQFVEDVKRVVPQFPVEHYYRLGGNLPSADEIIGALFEKWESFAGE
ncbi:MAG: 3-methyl-2-oxobutanoate dehydrogenase subunit VorB [Planctomycetaceae bacterium]|nr:3-methyl-2-oxobutanoate dehydrogenase subunit VorB [Planctomycetaceae bacterium]